MYSMYRICVKSTCATCHAVKWKIQVFADLVQWRRSTRQRQLMSEYLDDAYPTLRLRTVLLLAIRLLTFHPWERRGARNTPSLINTYPIVSSPNEKGRLHPSLALIYARKFDQLLGQRTPCVLSAPFLPVSSFTSTYCRDGRPTSLSWPSPWCRAPDPGSPACSATSSGWPARRRSCTWISPGAAQSSVIYHLLWIRTLNSAEVHTEAEQELQW